MEFDLDSDLCCGCLCAGRKMVLIDDFKKRCFLQILWEMQPMSQPEKVSLWLCWECVAQTERFCKFKQKVKKSFRKLQGLTKEVGWSHIEQHSSLKVSAINIINIYPNGVIIDDADNALKYEVKLEPCEKTNTSTDIKNESDNISIHSDRLDSCAEDPIVKDNELSKEVVKKRKCRSTIKIKKKKSKTQAEIVPEYIKEVELSPVEIENERSELRNGEEFVNAMFKCDNCILPFPNAEDLRDHITSKHELNATKFKCNICKCSFANEISYNYHTNRHKRRYECIMCEERFSSHRKGTKHYETYHCGISNYTCNICQNEFVSQTALDSHMSKAHDCPEVTTDAEPASTYPCDQCSKTFKWQSSLRKHMETHRIQTGEKRKPYCETCRLSFTTTSNLQKHVKTSSKHQIKLKLRKLPATDDAHRDSVCVSVNRARATHACPHCGKLFQWKGNLLRHMKSHVAKAAGELSCEPCGRSFASIATYNQHMRVSRKHVSENDFKYECNECGKKFANKIRLKDHVDWEHLKNYNHNCSICQKVFKSHTSLYLHRQVVHGKEHRDHLCDHCGKSFPNNAKLRAHVTALHSGASYACAQCGARFNWHSCLSRHVRVLHRNKEKGNGAAP
ncbi:zinc finger protein 879 [Plutella xylostella]|uniref:zinc finger protein 879 n=1 Tax=Plutella xylostella TaxID=51655 RepID=UPI0020324108|nr:zinc finger protein 879 [Plutella xylostella]